MAVYNELQVGRYVRFVQKLMSIKGRQPAPLQYSGELGTHLPLFHGRENRYLEGWNSFWTGFDIAAAAGFQSAWRARNPKGSNVVVVFEKLQFWTTAGDSFDIQNGPATTDLGTLNTNTQAAMDGRTNPQPSLQTSQQNTANRAGTPQLAGFAGRVAAAANVAIDYILTDIQEIVVTPGFAIEVLPATLNERMILNAIWRERTLEESELT